MGRAIDMEKDIDMLKLEVEKLNNIVRGMSTELSRIEYALEEYFEDDEEITKEKESGKKETNAKGNGKGNKSSDTADGDADTKSK